jgi:hypothetical protein
MCQKFNIAKETIGSFINSNKSFSLNSVNSESIKRGGVLRTSPNLTVTNCLNGLVNSGVLDYSLSTHFYKLK